MRRLRIALRIRDRVVRDRPGDGRAEDAGARDLSGDEEARPVVLVRRVVVDDLGGAARVDGDGEEVRHAPVPVARRAAEPFLADLPEVHRMLRRADLVDRGAPRGREVEPDLGQVDVPGNRRRGGAVREPRREGARVPSDRGPVPDEVDGPRGAADDPRPDVRVRGISVHLQRRGPGVAAVGGSAQVHVVVVRVDPGRIDIPRAVDRCVHEEISDGSARTGRRGELIEVEPRPLSGVHVARDQGDVVASDARQVQVAQDRIELGLSAGRSWRHEELVRCRREDEASGQIRRSGRSRRTVDLDAARELVDGQEDRVVGGSGRRAVVHGEPLPVLGRIDGERVFLPRVPAVVRHRHPEVHEALQVHEVREPLIVRDDVRVAASRRRIWPRLDRRDDVEGVPAVRRAVDEALRRGRAPRPGFPQVAVLVDVDHRLSLRPEGIGDDARSDRDAAGRARRVRRGRAWREREVGGPRVAGVHDEEGDDADLVDAGDGEQEEDRLRRGASLGGRPDEGPARIVDVQVEVVVTRRPGDLDADAAGVEGPEVRRDVDRQGEMIAHEIAGVGRRALLRKRGLRRDIGRPGPRDGRIRLRDRAAPRSRGRRETGDRREDQDHCRKTANPLDAESPPPVPRLAYPRGHGATGVPVTCVAS